MMDLLKQNPDQAIFIDESSQYHWSIKLISKIILAS